jgi:hypothetical protein
MSERTLDVQRDMALTRERMSETIDELEARISERISVVKERLDLKQLVEDHPWPALAVALGLGVLLAGTAADARSARAAKGAPGATADLARRAWTAAADVVRRDGNEEAATETEPGLVDRVTRTIRRATGVDELLTQMKDAATELARPASYAGRNVPRNTGQQM